MKFLNYSIILVVMVCMVFVYPYKSFACTINTKHISVLITPNYTTLSGNGILWLEDRLCSWLLDVNDTKYWEVTAGGATVNVHDWRDLSKTWSFDGDTSHNIATSQNGATAFFPAWPFSTPPNTEKTTLSVSYNGISDSDIDSFVVWSMLP